MVVAIPLAREGEGRERPQAVMDEQDAMGPRRPEDPSLAMRALLAVFRRQTRTMLERTLKEKRDFPRQPLEGLQRWGTRCGVLLGEPRSRGDRNVVMGGQHLTAWGLVQSRNACRSCEGRLLGHAHPPQPRAGPHALKTRTDSATTGAPRRQGARLHGASPLSSLAVERVKDGRGNKAPWPSALEKDAMGALKGIAALGAQNVGDRQISTTRDPCVETHQGGRNAAGPGVAGSRTNMS